MYEYTCLNVDTGYEEIIHGYTYQDAIKRAHMEDTNLKFLITEYID